MPLFDHKGEMLSHMLVLATTFHAGKLDAHGRPYILHPIAVMQMLHTDDEQLQCIAIGHDLIEDTQITVERLEREGFPDRVVDGIWGMTKRDGDAYEPYILRLMDNDDCVIVKMCDLRHNSDLTRLKGVTVKDVDRAIKYQHTYHRLRQIAVSRNLQLKYPGMVF